MAARVVMNRAALAELRTSAEFEAALTKVAQRVLSATASNAQMGSYKKSLDIEARTEDGETVVRVGTDDPFAHLDEWGSLNNPATGAMRRAVEGLGLEAEFS